MNWTVRIQDYDILRIRRPFVYVDGTIFSFGFSDDPSGLLSDDHGPMDVYMMNTNNYEMTVLPHSDSTPLKRSGHSAVLYDKKVYIWGGEFGWDLFPELLCFDTESSTWSEPATTGTPPTSCRHHCAFVIGKIMYILGGLNEPGGPFSQEIFTLDLESMQWGELVTEGSPVFDVGTWVCAIDSKVYVFLGESYYTSWNEGSCLDMHSKSWCHFQVRGWYPQLMLSAPFSYKENIYIFGGRCRLSKTNCNDLCRFSPATKKWEVVKPAGDAPRPRHLSSCIVCEDRLFLFGGIVNNFEMFGCLDFHVLDFSPSLRTLSLMAVIYYNLSLQHLPISLRSDAVDMSGITGVRFTPP
ncbi:Host cell factor [Gryllus bimaculatus]|nr:Host cell factor [Gryllus bimaculatus]